ncbi:hypothetical protein AALP_AA1G264600 [Arabis alpina]|uniref:Uncharacterized protein n=1 Tax=Arabis alpina TaxID=50452 RepID=A0A087HQU3_ARAAL|nr:hypothetical protein AALP_AA1G264600 [Arabis alpina]
MSSDSSASVKLNRGRIRCDPNVTLARASEDRLDTFIPMGIPLAGPSDQRVSDASSPKIELPEHRFHDVPQKVSRDSSSDGSSYARFGGDSKVSETSNRVETDEGTSEGEMGSLIDFRNAEPKSPGPGLGHGIRLDDSNDVESSMNSSRVYSLTPAGGWEGISIVYPQANDRPWSPPSGYMCMYECFIKNGGLCFPIPRLLLQYYHRRRISLSQLTHGSIRTMMAVVVLAAEHGGIVNLDEFEEISSFSPIGNSGRFYVSPRGGHQLVKGHSSQVNRHRWSRYFYVEIGRRTIGEFSRPIRAGWKFRLVEPVKRKTPKDSIITLLRKDKKHIRHWPDFLSHRIARSYPRFSTGDFYLPLEDNSPDAQQGSNKKTSSSQRKKSSTPSKKKTSTVQTRPKKSSMVKLNLDVVDSDEEFELPTVDPPTVREGLQPEKALITHGRGGLAFLSPPAVDSSSSNPDTRFAMSAISMLAGYNFLSDARYDLDQKNRKLNAQNGDLMNGELIASKDDLSSKVDALTSALAEAEEAKKDEVSRIEGEVAELRSSSKDAVARAVKEVKKKAKDKLRRSIEVMEERSRAQTEGDRLASLASQVVGAIRRMEKAAKDGVPIDTAKKEKLEARLASYTAEADLIVLPSLPTDSSDDDETEPKKNVALDISSSDSSDEEAERSEVDDRTSVVGKTPALTLAEIEEAANVEAEHVNQLTAELFGDRSEAEGDAGVPGSEDRVAAGETVAIEVPASIEAPVLVEEPAIDVATGELIAPLFTDSNLEELEIASYIVCDQRDFFYSAFDVDAAGIEIGSEFGSGSVSSSVMLLILLWPRGSSMLGSGSILTGIVRCRSMPELDPNDANASALEFSARGTLERRKLSK